MAPREPDQAEEQQPDLAQSTLADAMARGKAMVVAETADSRPAPPPEQEAKEDEVEEVLGCPKISDNMYMCRAGGTTSGLCTKKS